MKMCEDKNRRREYEACVGHEHGPERFIRDALTLTPYPGQQESDLKPVDK